RPSEGLLHHLGSPTASDSLTAGDSLDLIPLRRSLSTASSVHFRCESDIFAVRASGLASRGVRWREKLSGEEGESKRGKEKTSALHASPRLEEGLPAILFPWHLDSLLLVAEVEAEEQWAAIAPALNQE